MLLSAALQLLQTASYLLLHLFAQLTPEVR